LAEVKRRWAEYEAGRMEAIPWEEVRDSVRHRLESHD
jgi:putative addiction module component (TIGR02574 family)